MVESAASASAYRNAFSRTVDPDHAPAPKEALAMVRGLVTAVLICCGFWLAVAAGVHALLN